MLLHHAGAKSDCRNRRLAPRRILGKSYGNSGIALLEESYGEEVGILGRIRVARNGVHQDKRGASAAQKVKAYINILKRGHTGRYHNRFSGPGLKIQHREIQNIGRRYFPEGHPYFFKLHRRSPRHRRGKKDDPLLAAVGLERAPKRIQRSCALIATHPCIAAFALEMGRVKINVQDLVLHVVGLKLHRVRARFLGKPRHLFGILQILRNRPLLLGADEVLADLGNDEYGRFDFLFERRHFMLFHRNQKMPLRNQLV